MIWRDGELKNPLSGKPLKFDSAHSLTDGANRFPVIEAIPFLRVGRDDLRTRVLQKLDAGDEKGALMLLFQDQDDWARSEPPDASGMRIPRSPSSASFGTISLGNRSSMSHCFARGSTSRRAKSRTVLRRSAWCSDEEKSMIPVI